MRGLTILVLLTGCSASTVDLDLMSTLEAASRGVVVHDGGHLASVAMADQICQVDITTGAVVNDTDPSDATESLLDARGNMALALSDSLFELPLGGDVATVPFTVAPLDGRLTDTGVVALFADGDACGVARWDGAAATGFATDALGCGDGVAMDTSADATWIADGARVGSVSIDGEVALYDVAADLVAWDAADALAVVSLRGSDRVRALTGDGHAAWEVQVAGTVEALDVAAAEGVVVVSLVDDNGGRVLVLDGATGDALVEHLVPEVVGVAIADDGRSLALSTLTDVFFYSVDPHASPLDTPTTTQVEGLAGVTGATAFIGTTLAVVAIVD